ncbi:hypothetical protein LINGRAHAP2_LOCUS22443 [Linum grandiflorum]
MISSPYTTGRLVGRVRLK